MRKQERTGGKGMNEKKTLLLYMYINAMYCRPSDFAPVEFEIILNLQVSPPITCSVYKICKLFEKKRTLVISASIYLTIHDNPSYIIVCILQRKIEIFLFLCMYVHVHPTTSTSNKKTDKNLRSIVSCNSLDRIE